MGQGQGQGQKKKDRGEVRSNLWRNDCLENVFQKRKQYDKR